MSEQAFGIAILDTGLRSIDAPRTVLDFQAEYPVKAFAMESLIYLPMFIAGFGSGFYVHDWFSRDNDPDFWPRPTSFLRPPHLRVGRRSELRKSLSNWHLWISRRCK